MSYGLHLLAIWAPLVIFGLASFALWVVAENWKTGALAVLCGILAIGGSIFGGILTYRASATTLTAHIDKLERVTNSDGKGSRYLIYTPNEVFEDTDSLSFLKYNSSDLYGQLNAGKNYTCEVAGWRVRFFSAYRNLISCEEAK